MEEKKEKKARKPRSDKGQVQATERDMEAIKWIAEQYAIRFDQIQRLLSKKLPEGKILAETTTKDMVARWKSAGWIEYKRVLANDKGYAWVTRKGLQLVGLDEIFSAKEPAATTLRHLYAINQLRLGMDQRGYEWTGERMYRATLEKKKDKKLGPIPDAIIYSERTGKIALEIELSEKKPSDLYAKIIRLVRNTGWDETGQLVRIFPRIWFYVPNEKMKVLIVKAIQGLKEDELERVACGVEPKLLYK